ncbi:type IX secretion system membrane protein PorP/SprF, partial [Maribacter sp.]|nr:type IX secretion system membrane protein PorP/SprF [Maribacter sp.]
MSAKHTNTNLVIYVRSVLGSSNFRTAVLTALALFIGVVLFSQRIVFPGQDLLVPHLNDPSYIGLENRFNVTGLLQLANDDRRQHSQFIYAQIPFSSKLSFGADYFKDALDLYSYSTAMISARMKFDLGGDYSNLRLGVSGGIDSRRQTGFPAVEIPNMDPFVSRLNEGDTGFTYRVGIHYTYNALSIGGTYNKLPIQNTLARADQEDLLGYWIKDGFTAHIRYNFYLSETIRLTPLFRYLSYANDPIYEGAVLVDAGDKVSASLSYKNDYSINPAVQYEILDALQVGYSYEKAIGDVTFEDVHSLSITYRFKGDGAEESDWQRNAKENNRKIAAIKPKKPKKDKQEEQEPEAAEKVAAEQKAAEKVAAEKAAAEKAAAQEAAEKAAAE